MSKSNIGAILKDIIKERGFTQEDFANETGIGLSSLKKYISGQVSYSIETLEVMTETLHCSYDYLLGKSLTPEREIQDVKQATRLSDGALEKITHYAKDYDHDSESKRYLDTLSTLIQSNFLIERIVDYFFINPDEKFVYDSSGILPQNGIYVGDAHLTVPDIEDAYLIGIMRALVESKDLVGENVPQILRKYNTSNSDSYLEEDD